MSRKLLAVFVVLAVFGLTRPLGSASLSLELRGGYHTPASAEFRDIYGGGLTLAGQVDLRLTRNLSLWAGLDYLGKTGTIRFTGERTKIRIIPLTAGLKASLASASLRPYLAAGLGWFLYKETNVLGAMDGGVLGFLAQGGLLIKMTKSLSLDVYGRYLAGKTKAREPDILAAELGGFQGGLGLVVAF